MIQTSYFAHMKKMPPEDQRRCVAIVAYMPDYTWTMPNISELAPNKKMLWAYKNTADEKLYTEKYVEQLNEMGIETIAHLIPENAILICYESPEKFCHRHILAQYLKCFGIEVEEYQTKNSKEKTV